MYILRRGKRDRWERKFIKIHKKGYQIKGKYTVKINTAKEMVGYDKFPQSLMDEWDRVRIKLLGVMEKEKRYG